MFSIEIAAFAVLSNHHHVVLRVDTETPKQWSQEETVRRWHNIYKGTFISQRFIAGHALSRAEMSIVKRDAAIWKERLISISWFMRALNEPIARAANIEDSDFTSIKTRIDSLKSKNPNAFLAPFAGDERDAVTSGVPYHLLEYMELVDWTGRAVRDDKRGTIDHSLPPILRRLGLEASDWLVFATEVESLFGNWVGSPSQFTAVSDNVGQRWICSCEGSRRFF